MTDRFIKNVNLDSNVFETYSNGTEEKTEEDYRRFNKILSLIDKVIFLSKIKNIKIKYDINNLVKNNSEGISENLTNLNNCNLSLENYEALTEGINRFLNEAPALTLNPLNKMSEDNKVYKKD